MAAIRKINRPDGSGKEAPDNSLARRWPFALLAFVVLTIIVGAMFAFLEAGL